MSDSDPGAPTPPPPPFRRRSGALRWGLGSVVILAILLTGLWQISRARCFALVGRAVCHVDTAKPIVALTLDDGPTTYGVQSILPVLASHDAHATFFLIGREMEQRPELARTLVASGNEIANHSYSHVRMIGRSRAFYRVEIQRTDRLIRAAGGTPGLFRPPNAKKLIGLPLALQEEHQVMVMWDVEDPSTRDPAMFAREIVAEAKPGSIILIHAMYRANETARRALPLILDGLEAKGLKAVSMGELLRQGDAKD